MNRKGLLTSTALLVLLFLVGCASVGNEMNMADMNSIEKGKTTRQELIEMFGAPYSVGLNEDGNPTAIWVYSEARNTPQNFVPVVGLFAGRMETRTQQLVVIFDENDVVKSFTFNESDSPIKTGIL